MTYSDLTSEVVVIHDKRIKTSKIDLGLYRKIYEYGKVYDIDNLTKKKKLIKCTLTMKLTCALKFYLPGINKYLEKP